MKHDKVEDERVKEEQSKVRKSGVWGRGKKRRVKEENNEEGWSQREKGRVKVGVGGTRVKEEEKRVQEESNGKE